MAFEYRMTQLYCPDPAETPQQGTAFLARLSVQAVEPANARLAYWGARRMKLRAACNGWAALAALSALLGFPAWAQSTPAAASQSPKTHANHAPAQVDNALFVTDEWHNLTRKDGSGLYLDVVRAVFARQGVKVEYRLFPYARAVQQVKDHKADGWVASFMKEKNFPLYPKYHFDKNEQTIVFVKAKQKGVVSTATLKNQRVAWLRDFGLDRFIQEPMRVTELDSIASAFKMLESDRIDYFVGAKSDIEDYIKSSRQNMSNYGMAYALHLGLYMAFADSPRGAKLRDMWDTEMETFHQTDAFKAIYKKYGYPYPFP